MIVRATAWVAGLTACGIAMGLTVALVAARAVSPLLFGVAPLDPAAIAAVSAIVMGAAFAAAYLPARRAARVDPMDALRVQ